MWTDVIDLRDFYQSPLGEVARRMISHQINALWPQVGQQATGLSVLGIGYATPYLQDFGAQSRRAAALMPAAQGVLHWPDDGPGLVALSSQSLMPFPDNSIDRILLVHALESSEQLRPMLREVWRILSENGRLLVVVPNRRGIWARVETTPFGHGHPFTPEQISRLMRDTVFTPLRGRRALFMPPLANGMALAAAPAWEKIGNRFLKGLAGVLLLEASKQIYAAAPLAGARQPVLSPFREDAGP